MAKLKNADNFQDGERFRGAGLFAWVALGVGLVSTLLFFVLAIGGVQPIEVKNESGKVLASFLRRDSMAFSWLLAIVFFLTLGVGGLFWTMLHHATNSGWGTVVRRLMENLGFMIPVVLFLSLPLVLQVNPLGFRETLWEWIGDRKEALSHAEEATNVQFQGFIAEVKKKAEEAKLEIEKLEQDKSTKAATPGAKRFFEDRIAKLSQDLTPVIDRAEKSEDQLRKELVDENFKHGSFLLYSKRSYLNETFSMIRFLIYVLVLGGTIFLLRSYSIKQDTSGDPKIFLNLRVMSCVLLLPVAVCFTFLMFDWLMALDYTWFSTMWGVYLFAGAALNSMGVLILLLSALRKAGYLEKVVTREHYHIMGKLMHAFIIFWAYIAFSQFFLIWYANITEETKFYLTRNTGFWNTYTIAFLVVGHFFIPFLVLLIRYNKTTTWIICSVAVWNLIMHLLDMYWIIIADRAPSLTKGAVNWLPGMWVFDLLALLGVGGIFVFSLVKALGSASLFPCRDPRLDESLNLTN